MSNIKKRLKVKKTPVGHGVFARREFSADTVICEIKGEVMDADYESEYCMDLEGKATLEPSRPFCFLNHGCEPNCELALWKYRTVKLGRVRRLWLIASRDISAGEELTIDYAWPADAAIPCLCGSKNCRGWIVDPTEMRKLAGVG